MRSSRKWKCGFVSRFKLYPTLPRLSISEIAVFRRTRVVFLLPFLLRLAGEAESHTKWDADKNYPVSLSSLMKSTKVRSNYSESSERKEKRKENGSREGDTEKQGHQWRGVPGGQQHPGLSLLLVIRSLGWDPSIWLVERRATSCSTDLSPESVPNLQEVCWARVTLPIPHTRQGCLCSPR